MSALELCLEKKDYVVSRARLRLSNDYSVSSEGKVCCKCDVPNMATHFSGSLAVQNVLFSIIYGLIQSQIIYFGSYSNGLFIDVKWAIHWCKSQIIYILEAIQRLNHGKQS
ncbi:uncharacterized protein EI90DRAFT_3016156 [Cantharellus anzutake]|uniref:uncharacterized protein n=1 Tax=Cantharellus anzutake TaxID=1750568 RepID=UPI001903FEA6|nr:uncharacterized protein EI90DRAFT_3016156 [Cantharellus anzutake]KAF8332060.1 hypothetical protein EI90DRAFT_3016156 [Cantharellus anzutake]